MSGVPLDLSRGDDNNEMSAEDPKVHFWPNNRGDNLSKRVKNQKPHWRG